MKRAIVFAGGGTKGAYQAGVVKAIKELGISFDIVTGTSIGALNGCLLAQNDEKEMYTLWENLNLDDIMEDGMDMKFTFENLMNQTDLIKPFVKSYFDHKGANVEPLKEKINQLCKEERLQQSGIDFGLVTVEYPSLKPHELTYKDMKGQLQDYLLASASCFPAFPVHTFNGHGYIDGGYFDNLPIDLALSMGADEVIAVEITYERITHPHYENRPNITVIRPSIYNGQFLDFDKDLLERRQVLGYNDAMKKLGNYVGTNYTFYPIDDPTLEKELYKKILKYEGLLNRSFIRRNSKIVKTMPLTTIVTNRYPHPTMQEYLITALEVVLQNYGYDPLEVYHIDSLVHELQDKFTSDLNTFNQLIPEEMNKFEELKLKEKLESLSKKDLIAFLYTQMTNDFNKFGENWIYPFFSTEMLCAFLFASL